MRLLSLALGAVLGGVLGGLVAPGLAGAQGAAAGFAADDDAQERSVADRPASARAEEQPPRQGRGNAGAPMRLRVIAPPMPLDRGELQAALDASGPEVRQCLEQRPVSRTASVRVRLDTRARLNVRVSLRPSDAMLQQCVEVAVRRFVQPLQSRLVRRTLTASLRVSLGGIGIPPIRPPMPQPFPQPGRFDESQVHAALDAMRASLIECVSDLSPGMPGSIGMRVTVHPDGTMTLMGVNLPTGVRGPGSLGCLSSRVGLLRVSPPPGDRTVAHDLRL